MTLNNKFKKYCDKSREAFNGTPPSPCFFNKETHLFVSQGTPHIIKLALLSRKYSKEHHRENARKQEYTAGN